jgi:hypothetical protein
VDTKEAVNDEVDELEVAELLTIHGSMGEEGLLDRPATGSASRGRRT